MKQSLTEESDENPVPPLTMLMPPALSDRLCSYAVRAGAAGVGAFLVAALNFHAEARTGRRFDPSLCEADEGFIVIKDANDMRRARRRVTLRFAPALHPMMLAMLSQHNGVRGWFQTALSGYCNHIDRQACQGPSAARAIAPRAAPP